MREFRFRIQPTLRKEWIRYQERAFRPTEMPLRAGVAGAYLPRLRLDVPHEAQEQLAHSVPQCVSMALRYGYEATGTVPPVWTSPDWLADLLSAREETGTPGRRLAWLRAWGVRVDFPAELQFFRDGTIDLDRRLGRPEARLVYRWEEPWLRYLAAALREGIPPVLFVDLGSLYPRWGPLRQPHAVVLTGGDGRAAWINDPSRPDGPVRVGLGRLMDSLLPGEPLAALLRPMSG
jgi:hypothetical protein